MRVETRVDADAQLDMVIGDNHCAITDGLLQTIIVKEKYISVDTRVKAN